MDFGVFSCRRFYEVLAYLIIFCTLGILWKWRLRSWRPGFLSGLFFILLFSARFLLEFLKLPQSMIMDESLIQMGQLLSIPFILLGLALQYFGPRLSAFKKT